MLIFKFARLTKSISNYEIIHTYCEIVVQFFTCTFKGYYKSIFDFKRPKTTTISKKSKIWRTFELKQP